MPINLCIFCEPLSRFNTTSLPTFPFLLTVEKKESLCLNIVVITSRGGTWFFTVNLQNRRNQLLTTQFQTLRNAIINVKRDRPFEINAWVVLPEHMHCIWTLPEGDDDFSSRWREIKKQFTHACGLKNIWQPRFWEHAIRNTQDYRHHVDYIYINPVKHGWVKQVSDWPFSTFHRDVARGLYPIDWAEDVTDFSAGERIIL